MADDTAPITKGLSMLRKFQQLTAAFCFLALTLGAQAQNLEILDRIVAVVNDNVIMASELEERVNTVAADLRAQGVQLPPKTIFDKQVLERMVLEELQLDLARRNGIRVDDSSLNQALVNIARQNQMTLDEFSQAVREDGLNWARFREEIRREMVMSQLHQQAVARRIQVTDREVDRFLNSEMGKQLFNAEMHLAHILIEVPDGATPDEVDAAKQEAEKVVEAIRNGASFHEQALRHSAGNEALKGGDLGWREAAQWPTLFAEAAVALEVGDVSEPLRAGNGFHIIQLKDKRGDATQKVEQYKVRHILITSSAVRSPKQAEALIIRLHQDILNGADFAALAKEYSNDPGSARDGGNLGWVNPGEMVPEFEKTYRNTPIGELSPVFQSEFGWHFLEVLDKRTTDMSEEYRRIKARQTLQQRRFEEELEQWVRELRGEAYVDVRL